MIGKGEVVTSKGLFVKFVPWNEKTIANLINRAVKFSTVFEFNDFNEYRYIAGVNSQNNEIIKILESEIRKIDFINALVQSVRERCSEEFRDKIIECLKKGENSKLLNPSIGCLPLLEENLAYANVGIFCISSIAVFDDDSAQLMFAHYAQNLRGIALIYKIEIDRAKAIEYKTGTKFSEGISWRVINWYNADYSDVKDFLSKSEKWKYENEYRMFLKPGIKSDVECGVELKAILYTPRFDGNENTLSNINKGFYNGSLLVDRVYQSSEKYEFLIGNHEKISLYLREKL